MFITRLGTQLASKKLQRKLFKKWPHRHFFVFGNVVSFDVDATKQEQTDIEDFIKAFTHDTGVAYKAERLPF